MSSNQRARPGSGGPTDPASPGRAQARPDPRRRRFATVFVLAGAAATEAKKFPKHGKALVKVRPGARGEQ
jgi:hypothetical protein